MPVSCLKCLPESNAIFMSIFDGMAPDGYSREPYLEVLHWIAPLLIALPP